MFVIQKEIRFADLLELMKTKEVYFYICHHVAWMLKDQFTGDYPAFQEQHERECIAYNALDSVSAAPYYYLNSIKRNELCHQVMVQLNAWLVKLFPEWRDNLNTVIIPSVIIGAIMININGEDEMDYQEYRRTARMELIKMILKSDPDAVISINFQAEN